MFISLGAILTAILSTNLGFLINGIVSASATIVGAGIGAYLFGTIVWSLRASATVKAILDMESQREGIALESSAIAALLASLGAYLALRERRKGKLPELNLWGRTSFYKADLANADLSYAKLSFANFTKANLTQTCFRSAAGIHSIRVKHSYLNNFQVRQLLVTGKGNGQTFNCANLRGVNLAGANLADARFIETDLSEANLANADLSRARLIHVRLDYANLLDAILTGAYLEDCSLNSETQIARVQCEYFFKRIPTPDDLIGHPNTKEDWTLSEGKVIQKTELELRTPAFSASGSSGSPVLDEQGRVVGLTWGSRSDSGQFTYSIAFPIAPIRDRLHRWGIL